MKKYFFIGLFVLFVVFVLNIITLFNDNTQVSSSITQKWKQYDSLDDWDMPSHAVLDIDGDGQMDEITFGNCAYLSTVKDATIPKEQRCSQPESIINPTINRNKMGQSIFSMNGYTDKTFLVLTKSEKWRVYSYNWFFPSVVELGPNNLFLKATPSFLDIVDSVYYGASHIFVPVILIIIFLFTHGF